MCLMDSHNFGDNEMKIVFTTIYSYCILDQRLDKCVFIEFIYYIVLTTGAFLH